MPAFLRVSLFGGVIPRLADRGLPDNAAQYALNAKLFSGELRAWNKMRVVAALPIANAKTVYHYQHVGADRYLAFPEFTNVVKAPLINDAFGRLYWTGSTGAFVNTTTRIDAPLPAFRLGVPAPIWTFAVVPTLGTAATAETRVYIASLVTAYGEESDASSPVRVSGNADGTWTVNGLDALGVDTANYPNITTLRLYRTITSSTGVDYRKVSEWAIGARPASYIDNVAATVLAASPLFDALGWTPPPAGLKGIISVAGGFLAGFVGRTVRLSVPYYPHAWPEIHQFAVDDDVVALGTVGNTIVITTKGRAHLLMGQAPEVMSLAKLEGVQPCLSARSLTSTSSGVLYASTDGLVLIDGGTNKGQIVSRSWVTKDEWGSQFGPSTQMAAVYQDRYFAFYTSQLGFTIGFDDPSTGFTELQFDGVLSVDQDVLTGNTLITVGSTVYEWDGDTTGVLSYTWRSKPTLVAKPVNMGVIQLRGSFVGSSELIPTPAAVGISGWAMNARAINGGGSTRMGGSINGPPNWIALGAAPALPAAGPSVAVKVYGDDQLRWFGPISTEQVQRLPSGYKAVLWEVEVQGISPLFSITMAETSKGLENLP